MPRVNGRRGAFQIVLGVVYLVVGASFFLMPASANRESTFAWLTPYVPLGCFASLWIIAACVAFVSAFRPRPKDAAGFIALVVAPGIWFGLFIIGGLISGNALAPFSAVIYGGFGVVVLIVAGMQGPRDRDTRRPAL